ncbi:MAG: hypothetical protein RPS47_14605 [Colwellia sp.]
MINKNITKLLMGTTLTFIALGSEANSHYYPDITGYENAYIGYQVLPSVRSELRKGKKDAVSGDESPVSLRVERVIVGLKRERYDNKYAYVALMVSKSKSGDASIEDIGLYEAKLNHEVAFIYGSGIHLTPNLDWNLYIGLTTAKMTVDNESDEATGVELGSEILIGLSQYVDMGVNAQYSSHYHGGGLVLNLNF